MSRVWKYFEKIEDKVKCTLCLTKLSHNSNSTGNMLNHLRLKHPMQNLTDEQQPALSALSFNPEKKRPCNTQRSEQITELIVNMIVNDLMPLKSVESPSFISLIKFLEPNYNMPCRKTITSRIMYLHDLKKKQLKDELKSASIDTISVTTDSWMSMNAESFTTMTAHYIKDWKLKSVVLATEFEASSHTADNLKMTFEKIISDYEIEDKIKGCVHDNAANIVSAVRQSSFIKDDINCTAHTLQLSINYGLEESPLITKTIAAGSHLVGHFKHSYAATGYLKAKQDQLQIKQNKLIQRCKTRWNSTADMFERLLEQRWAINAVLSDRTATKHSVARTLELRDEQWQVMEDILPCLKALKTATIAICPENDVSISLIVPVITALVTIHLVPTEDDLAAVIKLKNTVTKDIKLRFKDIFQEGENEFNLTAVVMSPFFDIRYKTLNFFGEQLKVAIIEKVALLLEKIELEEGCNLPANKKARVESDAGLILQEFLGTPSISEILPTSRNELTQYLLLQPQQNSPLEWWQTHNEIYPRLAKLAKGYLGIPASSVPSERMFSAAGRLVTKLRNRLSAKNVDSILFLNKNK